MHNKNGAFNLQGLTVNSKKSVSTFTKLNNAFKSYNGNLTKSTQLQNAYVQTVGNQNKSLGNYLAGLNGVKASIGGYIASLVGTKVASIALQAASLALNSAITMGLSFAISTLVSGISKWINKGNEAREQAIENAKTAKEETNNFTELLTKYNQLTQEVKSNAYAKDSLVSAQDELLKSLGIEKSELDDLIKKYGNLNIAINQVTLDALKDKQSDLLTGYNFYKEELSNAGGDGFWGGNNLINASGKDSVKAFDVLKDAKIVDSGSYGTAGGVFALIGDDTTVDGILENYSKIKSAIEALDKAVEDGVFEKEELSENSLYNALSEKEKALRSYVNNYNSSIDDVNENSANQEIISSLIGNELPKTEEEFEIFKQGLVNAAQESNNFIGSQEDIKDSVINALAEMPEFSKYFNELADAQSSTINNKTPTLSISSTIDQLNTHLKPAFDSLQSAYQNIFTQEDGKEVFALENVDLSILDSIKSSLDNMGKELNIDVDYSDFENLTKVLTDSSSTAKDAQKSFDSLASSLLNNTDFVKNLDSNTAQLVTSMLESFGVANAEEIVYDSLASKTEGLALQKQFAAEKGLELTNAEAYQVVAFLDNAGASETARQYLLKLLYAEQVFNNQDLSTKGKVEKLNELAKAYGDTAVQSMTSSIMVRMDHDGNFDMDSALKDIQKATNAVNNAKVNLPQKANLSTKSTGKSTTDEYLDSYKKELSELEQLHSMEEITDREFYETLLNLNQTYFNDTTEHHEKYLDEYQANEEKVAQGLKDVWTKYWEDYKSDLDKVSSYAERVLSKQIDSLKNQQEQEVDGKELEIDAIDDKISALNKEKDVTEKLYQDQIDVIQYQIDSYNDEIDKLREINEEKNRQLTLEQDLYELERLRNQKTQKEYVDGKGTVYKTDSSAIRDQEQQIENDKLDIEIAGYENLIKGLESQQDSLKEKMYSVIGSIDEQIARLDEQKDGIQEKIDTINLGYEAQIEALERYKEKWTEVSDYQAILDEEALARQLLGIDAEQNILAMREDILNDYISKYQLASDNLTLISDAKLFEIKDVLAQMQSAADLVDTTNVKESLTTIGTVADTTRDQISNVTSKFNDLANEVSTFTLPPINTEQFISSLGTAEGSTGILGQLQTFTDRFREICDLIPTSWKNALDSILGSGPTDGKGTDYNILFLPLLSAMDNCKSQMDTKLTEYATAWIDFNTNLGAIIGISGGDADPSENPNDGAKSTNGNKKEENPNSANSIISTIRTGGTLINAEFNDTWIPGFQSMGEHVNDICSKIVSCVNQMAEKTVNACRTAIDAINKANAAKESSSSKNSKPPIFYGDSYEDISFADSKLALKSNANSSLAGELGAKLVFNGKTNQYRYVSRNGAEFTNSTYNIPEGYTQVNRTEHLMKLQSKSSSTALPQDIDITKFSDLLVTDQNRNSPFQLNSPLNLNSLIMKDIIPTPVTQEINLSLPNVTNESGAQYIIKTLKELPSDTIQYTHRH